MRDWIPPVCKPFSSAKHREKPATPRTRISVQTPRSILISPGAQRCYANRSPSLQLQALALSLECTLVGPVSPLPFRSSLSLPGPGHTARSLQLVMQRSSVCGAPASKAARNPGAGDSSQPVPPCVSLRIREWVWSESSAVRWGATVPRRLPPERSASRTSPLRPTGRGRARQEQQAGPTSDECSGPPDQATEGNAERVKTPHLPGKSSTPQSCAQ